MTDSPAPADRSGQSRRAHDAGGVERVVGYTQELNRSLSFRDLLVYGLIFMVPIAPFGIFGSVDSSSGGMVALAYIVGGVAMVFTSLSYAEMSRAFPVTGSVCSYAGLGRQPLRPTPRRWPHRPLATPHRARHRSRRHPVHHRQGACGRTAAGLHLAGHRRRRCRPLLSGRPRLVGLDDPATEDTRTAEETSS